VRVVIQKCKYDARLVIRFVNPLVPDVPILGTVVITGLVCATSNIFSVCWILVN